jgi:hypothetical protein
VSESRIPSFKYYLPVTLFLFLFGWGGFAFVILSTLPTLGPRWLFFFFGVLALTGTAIPVSYFINLRFPSNPPASSGVIIRQACWVGIYGGILAWLQLGRVLTPVISAVLAGAFMVIEIILRMRERSRFVPGADLPDEEEEPSDHS